MLTVKNSRVRSLDRDYFEVSWELADTQEDVFDYTFQVLRSESPSGPFEAVSPLFSDRYLFVDNAVPVGDRWRLLHYVIRVTAKGGEEKDFGPFTHDPEPDLLALELRRHIQLLLHEHTGRRCWVLPARTFGQRCPDCWDMRLQKRTKSRCVVCFDTGFVRGYLSPIEVWAQFEPSPKSEQTTNVGPMQQSNTTCRVGYYPPLKPRDLIIEPENRRWRVTQVVTTEQLRAPVHQEVQVHEVPPRDIEFEIPLVLDHALRDLWYAPVRNFSNPQNREMLAPGEAEEIFSLYRSR